MIIPAGTRIRITDYGMRMLDESTWGKPICRYPATIQDFDTDRLADIYLRVTYENTIGNVETAYLFNRYALDSDGTTWNEWEEIDWTN